MSAIAMAHVPAGQETDIPTREATLQAAILAAAALPAGTLAALAGSSGTPSANNKFATSTDPRFEMGARLASLHGLAMDGATDDAAPLLALGNLGGIFQLDLGKTCRVATAITLPKNVTIKVPRSAMLLIDGVQLTINGTIDAGLHQVFTCVNGGTVSFSTSNAQAATKRVLANAYICSEWWGAQWDGVTDDTAAHNAAFAAMSGLPTNPASAVRFAGPPVQWFAGTSRVTDALLLTDVVGPAVRGAGNWNTYINFTAGEIGTATGGSTTTLANSAKAWAVNQWGSGRWQAYIYAGAGAGQWGDIASNDATTLTFSSALAIAPDATSQYAIAIKAVLDLDGFFSGTLSDFQITATGFCRHGVKYYRRPSLSLRGSSQGRIDRVTVTGNYVDSAWQFGGNDVTAEHGFQADLVDIAKCQAFGKGATTGIYAMQSGYIFGDSTFANALNFTATGCESVSNAYGLRVSATNLVWMGGTNQSSTLADVFLNQGNQGHVKIFGNRSEGSRTLLDSASSEIIGVTVEISDYQFQLDQFQGRDLIALDYGTPTMKIDGIRTSSPTLITGTATSGSATTLTNLAANFSTATVTTLGGGSTVGLAGWDLQITAGTGVGQRTQVSSNTSTQLTFPALAIALDATSQYQLMPRPRINVNCSEGHIEITRCLLTSPIETWVQSSGGFVSTYCIRAGCAEVDKDGNTVTRMLDHDVFGSLDARHSGGLALAGSGLQPDIRLMRLAAGLFGTPALSTAQLTIAPFGTTPTGLAQSVGGSTTRNFKLVAVDGQGRRGLASATFSCTNSPATLGGTAKVNIYTANPPGLPAVWYDVLTDDGNPGVFGRVARVPWYQISIFLYVGQQTAPYTLPVVDETLAGGFAHSGKAGFFGATPIAQPTVTGSKANGAALTSLLAQLAALGLIVDGTSA